MLWRVFALDTTVTVNLDLQYVGEVNGCNRSVPNPQIRGVAPVRSLKIEFDSLRPNSRDLHLTSLL